jgi:hypothetical protein
LPLIHLALHAALLRLQVLYWVGAGGAGNLLAEILDALIAVLYFLLQLG